MHTFGNLLAISLKILIPIAVSLCSIEFSFGQDSMKTNCVYLEAGGNGIFGSINFEHQFSKRPGLGIRTGLGFYSDEIFHFAIPISLNYLFTLKEQKSFIDAGLGGTWTTNEETATGSNFIGKGDIYPNLMLNLGYRRHTKNNIMWRLNLLFVKNQYGFGPWIGAAIGKRF